jgi:DNA repair photolyase
MKIQEILCKTALSASTLPGLTYSLNPYRGCQHNCAYCYAPNVLRLSREYWGDSIEAKTNIPLVLSKELKTKKHGVIGISTVTDPYQPVERTFRLTRACLEQLLPHDFPAHIQTKSALVSRDIDLISQFSDAQVMMSIGTLNDQERRLLEPSTSPIQDRLAVLRKLTDAGIKTAIFFGPVYPAITDEDIPVILEKFKDSGASEIWIDRLNLKPGIWESISKILKQHHEMYQVFTKNLFENKDYYPQLRQKLHQEGKARGLKIIDAF